MIGIRLSVEALDFAGDAVDVGPRAEIADLLARDPCLDVEVLRDVLKKLDHGRHLPLLQQVDLQVEVGALVGLRGEAILATQNEQAQKNRFR